MGRKIVSNCHSLCLVPIHRLVRFARIDSRVYMLAIGGADDAQAIPGSMTVSTSTEDNKIKTEIAYERDNVSPQVADILEKYKVMRFVATYVDETGNTRVAGSPRWPLSLDYTTEGGVFKIEITGYDIAPNAFLKA